VRPFALPDSACAIGYGLAVSVLVTGLHGFLGSHLGRRLVSEGHEVHAIVRPGSSDARVRDFADKVHRLEADLEDVESYRFWLARLRPERAFHVAWYARHGRFWSAPENLACVAMTLQLARELAEAGCEHLVGVGSCAEYAWHHGFLSEARTPLAPASLYGVAKNATRSVLEAWAPQVDLRIAWARIFFPFGPGEPAARLIPSVTRALLAGERARCSHGAQIRDFLHVEDCAEALRAISERRLEGAVNVGSGEPIRIRALVERLAGLTGRGAADLDFGAVAADPDEPPVILADTRRLEREAGFRPGRTLDEALADTVEWWRSQT
jgi:nucleoside-diphosphate-sugar epimerase